MRRTAIHPGKHLAEQLETLNIPPTRLGRWLRIPLTRLTGILRGEQPVTADIALRLGHFFGNSPEFWLNLQAIHDLRLARSRARKAIGKLPTADTCSAVGWRKVPIRLNARCHDAFATALCAKRKPRPRLERLLQTRSVLEG